MNIDELRGKSRDELNALLLDSKKELLNLRFQQASGEMENTSRFKVVRRTVARIRTVMNQPEGAAAPKAKAPKAAKPKTAAKASKAPAKKADAKKPAKKAATA